MTPTYHCSSVMPASSMSLDPNDGDDQIRQASSSSSSPVVPYPHHDQSLNHFQTDHEEIIIPSGRSRNKEDMMNDQINEGSVKWMPSKMRIMGKMMTNPDQTRPKFEDHQKQALLSSPETDNNNCSDYCSNHNNNINVRVCVNCYTTTTPLWRSGPTGPKSLCNACGIRQRKARRAMAESAAASPEREKKIRNKQKKPQLKKKPKLGVVKPHGGRKKFVFEDFAVSLSKNLSLQQVFPQDEKEAAILLMALSYGLVNG